MTSNPDAGERALADYPHPSVAVDTAVVTIDTDGALAVLLVEVDGSPRLPGTFLHEGERLSDAVLRSLADKASVTGLTPTQLHVFDDPARDDRGWVLSVAHLDVVPARRLALGPQARLSPAAELPSLPWDHREIVAKAVDRIRDEYREAPDPRGLTDSPFTLRELRAVHESVAGVALLPDSFRRLMEPQLVATDTHREGTVGKPARLYTREART